jgi:hypothetical protein
VNEGEALSAVVELVARLEAAVKALEGKATDDPPLCVADVRARYGLADDRAARKLMHKAGSFILGNRLFSRRSALVRLEDSLTERHDQIVGGLACAPRRRRRRQDEPQVLKPGFWRQ